jgi:hypothetical protein
VNPNGQTKKTWKQGRKEVIHPMLWDEKKSILTEDT